MNQLVESLPTGLYIGGAWEKAASDGAEFDVYDPSTAEVMASVPNASVADALAAVTAAHDALPAWAGTAPRARAEVLRRAYELMIDQEDRLATLIVLEMGKTYSESAAEVRYAAEFFRWFSEEAVRNIGSVQIAPGGDKRIMVVHQPIGVSLLITPWNFPAAMATRKIGPALAAGCTVVLKPASDTPLTALALADLLERAGVPAGVVNVLPSRRSSEVVPAMLEDPRVRKLSFTGSTAVGSELLGVAARHIVDSSMELGGNAPFLVFEDADIEAAVAGAMIAKMRNGGQSCIAANRFYVHESVADDFSSRLAAAMGAVTVGPGLDEGVELGPLINSQAQQDMGFLVGSCVDAGGSVAVGGQAPDRAGYFWEPTVLADVSPDNPILDHEIFGPVAPVVSFAGEEEAITLANDSLHGLAAYLYTGDLERGLRVAEAIETGMVGVNRGLISDPAAPFGGVKESGLGREGGQVGMHEYLETKYIAVDW
ncbi:MAG: NAD-dependent succinate-semialdehyde dehydrogenase [Acidimicrobiia bacterium]|nr:MAG: NAD-dependent succinate-semialdehyde dehydrogenase [Acidimicrobiia bacterium]